MEYLKKDIRKLTRKNLQDFFTSENMAAYRGDQVYDWLWRKSCISFDEMSNLSKSVRNRLKETFKINPAQIEQVQKSVDLTLKSSIKLKDGLVVEAVLIPSENRITACVSSQVGCSLDCRFCATAKIKQKRNLDAAEIYDQIVLTDKQSRDFFHKPLSNIVFMGMGEPLLNYKQVLTAIDRITSEEGLNFSPKRITLSTAGIPKMIKKLADDRVKFNLAISLHSAREELRNELMPFSKNFPLNDLVESLRYWHNKTKRRVTFEYIVWEGINDTEKDIFALLKFSKYVPCKVNLITYNPVDELPFKPAKRSVVEAHRKALESSNITSTVRQSRGSDIDAACGQLANKIVRNK